MKTLIIVSIVIIIIWLAILSNDKLSRRFKAFITSLVVASPIPPIP